MVKLQRESAGSLLVLTLLFFEFSIVTISFSLSYLQPLLQLNYSLNAYKPTIWMQTTDLITFILININTDTGVDVWVDHAHFPSTPTTVSFLLEQTSPPLHPHAASLNVWDFYFSLFQAEERRNVLCGSSDEVSLLQL